MLCLFAGWGAGLVRRKLRRLGCLPFNYCLPACLLACMPAWLLACLLAIPSCLLSRVGGQHLEIELDLAYEGNFNLTIQADLVRICYFQPVSVCISLYQPVSASIICDPLGFIFDSTDLWAHSHDICVLCQAARRRSHGGTCAGRAACLVLPSPPCLFVACCLLACCLLSCPCMRACSGWRQITRIGTFPFWRTLSWCWRSRPSLTDVPFRSWPALSKTR